MLLCLSQHWASIGTDFIGLYLWEGFDWLFIRAFASGQASSDEANTASDDGSLYLPHQASMAPCRVVEPYPNTYRQDQQRHQASISEVFHGF